MWPWGSAIACTVRRSEQLLHSLQGFKGFKGKRLRPGKRQAWTPITGCKGFKGFEAFKAWHKRATQEFRKPIYEIPPKFALINYVLECASDVGCYMKPALKR